MGRLLGENSGNRLDRGLNLASGAPFRASKDKDIMAQPQADKEVHISLEDLKDELKAKKNEIQTLDDASVDLMELEDDEEKVPYQIGEVFVFISQDEAQERLE